MASAKALANFAKENEAFSLKAGLYEGSILDRSELEALAKLPPKEELYGKLLGLLSAPATRSVQVLNGPGAALARLLEAWRKQREEAGE